MNKIETLEAANRLYPVKNEGIMYEGIMYMPTRDDLNNLSKQQAFIAGAKWQQEQDSWKRVNDETPPIHIELLVKSPDGIVHLSSWREAYQIFTCQDKSESSLDWQWKTI